MRSVARRLGVFELTAAGSGLLALLSAVITQIWGGSIRLNGGCGVDGAYYCAAAAGRTVAEPFSRRVLAPLLVRLTAPYGAGEIVTRFRVLDAVSLLVVCGFAGWLTWRIARERGAAKRRSAAAVAIVLAFIVAAPMSFRWTSWYPVLVDDPSLALAVAWLAAFLSRAPAFQLLSLPLAAAAILTRETWAAPIAIAALVRVIDRHTARAVSMSLLTVGISVATFLVAYRMPYSSAFYAAPLPYARGVLGTHFGSEAATLTTSWEAIFGLGLVPLVLLHPAALRRLGRSRAGPVLAVFFGNLALATFGGGDVQRYVFAGLPFLLPLCAGIVAATPSLDTWLVPLAAATLALWRPFQFAISDDRLFVPQYYPNLQARIAVDAAIVAVVLLATAGLMAVWHLSGPSSRQTAVRTAA